MRLAAVDIGSNTVHVLVADVVRGRLQDVAHYVEMPELGSQVARTGSIGSRGRPAIPALPSAVPRARIPRYDPLTAGATSGGSRGAAKEGSARHAHAALPHPLPDPG